MAIAASMQAVDVMHSLQSHVVGFLLKYAVYLSVMYATSLWCMYGLLEC